MIGILAWVVRYFVPLVVDDPKLFWGSMLARMPLVQYMSTSDLAFAMVVLEHNMMKWRRLIHYQLETGRLPCNDYCKQADGLMYKNGIAGEECKRRFDNLCLYFFSNFCTDKCSDKDRNVRKLQAALDDMAKAGSDSIKSDIQRCTSRAVCGPQAQQIQDDIIHRVFYYSYL